LRLLSVGSLPPEWGGPQRGGVATFHAALLEGLAERAGEVELLGVMTPAPQRGEAPVPVFPRPASLSTAHHYEALLARLEPDVVLMNHVANTVGVTHAGLDRPPPAIGIAHSWHNVTFREDAERERAFALTAQALAGLACLVCPSRHCREEGEWLGLEYPARVETIHYPLQPLYGAGAIELDGGGRGGVAYAGSLVARKNPAALVRAAASLPGVDLTVVGEGPEEDELWRLIDELALANRVLVTGLPGDGHRERLRDLFLRSSALCLPSSSESFGIVFIEALACGTPVVGFAPTVREIRDAVGVEIGEPLEGSAPEAIAAAIERVRARAWDRGELRRRTLEAFGLARTVDTYVELMRRVSSDADIR
jgi:glycosyltransferase involved in cell wall biosynthesis